MAEKQTYRSEKFEIVRLASNSVSNNNVLSGGRNPRERVETSGKLYGVKCLKCTAYFQSTESQEDTPGSFTRGAGWIKFMCAHCDNEEAITGGEAP
jgi:hypothetical protein